MTAACSAPHWKLARRMTAPATQLTGPLIIPQRLWNPRGVRFEAFEGKGSGLVLRQRERARMAPLSRSV